MSYNTNQWGNDSSVAITPQIAHHNPADSEQQSGTVDTAGAQFAPHDTFAVLGKPEKQHLGLPYDENYFNCMDWFADQTLVDVRLKSAAPFAASLHPVARRAGEVHLEEGERLTLPLAAVTLLAEHGLVEVCVPPCFTEENLQNLKENPRLVNLRRLEPYFFEVGLTIARLTQDVAAFGLLMSTAKTRSSLLTKIFIDELDVGHRAGQSSNRVIESEVFLEGLTASEAKVRQSYANRLRPKDSRNCLPHE